MSGFRSQTSIQAWLPVCSLGLAAFIFVTTELMPIGLLPDMAKDLGKTESFTGLLMTCYAWTVAIISLPLTIITEKIDRRKLLMGIFAVFIISHGFILLSNSFATILASRIGIAFAHALFWSISTPLAARLAPEGRRSRAIAIIVTGVALASVLGVPLGTLMGHQMSWRAAFAAVGVVALCIMVILAFILPALPSNNTNNLRSLPTLFKRKTLMKMYLVTLLIVTGSYTAFSYLTPFLENIANVSKDMVVIFLLTIGLSGILGAILVSKYVETYPKVCLLCCTVLLSICFLSLLPLSPFHNPLIGLCVLWGMAMAGVGLVFQTIILRIASDSADIATSIYSAIYNVGIGGGAFIGSYVYKLSSVGHIGIAAGIFTILAFLLAATLTISPDQPEKLDIRITKE